MTMQVCELMRFAFSNSKVKCLLEKHAPELNVERLIAIVDASKSAKLEISTYDEYHKKYSTIIDDISSDLTRDELHFLKKYQKLIHLWVFEFFAETSDDDDDDDDDNNIEQTQKQKNQIPNKGLDSDDDDDDADDDDANIDEVDYESMDSEDCYTRNDNVKSNIDSEECCDDYDDDDDIGDDNDNDDDDDDNDDNDNKNDDEEALSSRENDFSDGDDTIIDTSENISPNTTTL